MTDRDELLARCDLRALLTRYVGEPRGGRWSCPAPAHGEQTGKTPPVSVYGESGGRYDLWHCHGCGEGRTAIDVLTMVEGLDVAGAFARLRELTGAASVRPPRPPQCQPLPTAAQLDAWHRDLIRDEPLLARLFELKGWTRDALARLGVGWNGDRLVLPVYDAGGSLVNVASYLPGNARKMLALKGRPRDLFPAPESLPSSELWIVEGEPDAVSMATLGLPAVAVPGASNWRKAYAQRFAGRDVVVCCDCDDAGRKLARRIAGDLTAAGVRGRVLDLDSERADGYDVGDLVAQARSDKDRAAARALLFTAAAELIDPIVAAAPPSSPNGEAPKLRRLDVAKMVRRNPPPVPWVIEGLVVRGALTVLNGREGEGKSLLAMALAAGVALGESQAGLVCHAGKVLIVDTENGAYETHRRVHALGLPGSVEMYEPDDGKRFDLRTDLADVDRLLTAHKPDLFIADSFRTLWGGEENDSGDVAKVLDPLRNLVRKHNCGTILLHHSGKGSGSSYRGSSAIGASAELGFTLAREESDNDCDRRSLACWKCRPAPKPPKAWLRLSVERGMVFVDEAEPPEEEAQPAKPVVSQLTAEILAAAGEVPTTLAELARRVGRKPKDGSVRNALSLLQRDGEMYKTSEGWCRVQRCKPPRAVAPLHPSDGLEDDLDGELQRSKEIKAAASRQGIAERTLKRAARDAGVGPDPVRDDRIAPPPTEQSAYDNLPLATLEEEALLIRHRDIDNPEAA